MKTSKLYFILVLILSLFFQTAKAQYGGGIGRGDASDTVSGSYLANTWKTNTGSSSFTLGTNWTDGHFPLAYQYGAIPSGGTQPIITASDSLPIGTSLEIGPGAVLTIENSANFIVNPKASITINGTLVNNGNVVLESDSSGTAFIKQSSGNVTGNITVKQYIPPFRKYRLLAHPFNSVQNLNILIDNFDITGNTTGVTSNPAKPVGTGFVPTVTNNPSAFRFSTADANGNSVDGGWKAFTSADGSGANNNWGVAQGIRIMIRGTKGQGLDIYPYTPQAVTLDMNGAINIGDVSATLEIGGSGAGAGFNLIGNPYPSPIDLSAVVYNAPGTANINKTVYLRNPQTGQWISEAIVSGTPFNIPAYSAFLVKNTGLSAITLPFSEAHKANSSTLTTFKRSNSAERLILQCKIGGTIFDNLNILFGDNYQVLFEDQNDAVKIGNDSFNFNAVTPDNVHVCTNALPINNQLQIPLFTNIRSGNAEIELVAKDYSVSGYELYLNDKLLNKQILINKDFKYSYTIDAKVANTFGSERFSISAQKMSNGTKELQSVNHFALYPNPATTQINLSLLSHVNGVYDAVIYNQLGQEIARKELDFNAARNQSIGIETLENGVYFLTISNDNTSQTIRFSK